MEYDNANVPLIRALRDGRRKFREVADELGLAENTVRSRYRKLQESGVLDVCALVDPERLEGHQAALVGMKVKSADLVRAGERIAGLRGVVSVRVVTGRYDLLVDVLLRDGFGLLEFFTEEVAKVDDVQDFETFVVYKSFGHRVPYVL